MCKAEGIQIEGLVTRARHKANITITGPNDPRRYQARIARIYIDVELTGCITADQLARLQTAVEHCPLANTLHSGPKIVHNLKCLPRVSALGDDEIDRTTDR